MGKNQKKKKGRAGASKAHAQQPRRAGVSKAHAVASPATMAPVPLSLGDTSAVDSCSGTYLPKIESTSCKHVESGVNLRKLGKQFCRGSPQECHDCTRLRPQRLKGRPKAVGKKTLWICLACGQVGCGPDVSEAKHKDGGQTVIASHATAHSNTWLHPVVMQWGESLDCWCLLCNAQLDYGGVSGENSGVSVDEKSSKVAEQPESLKRAAALLQETLFSQPSTSKVGDVDSELVTEVDPKVKPEEECEMDLKLTPEVEPEVEPEVTPVVDEGSTSSSSPTVEAVKAVSPKLGSRRAMKGLMNLGNTCFFNSVMQNLVGVSMLREHFSKEASAQEGVLKVALRRFFQEMDPSPSEKIEEGGSSFGSKSTIKTRSFGYNAGNGAVSPRGLFSAICTKAPRFKGFQQQDSHELLRCLLDGLHMEEESIRKAQKSAVEKSVGSAADSDAKEEGPPRKLPDTLVEHMFGGQFSSTVSCCECGHFSVTHEPFLDLSLPIPSKPSSGKGDSFSLHLPKLIAPRSQSHNISSNGVVGTKAIGCSPLDNKPTGIEAPKQPAIVSVRGVSLQSSIAGGRAASAETSNECDLGSREEKKGSTSAEQDQVAQEVQFNVNPFPCESIPNSSGTEKIDSWIDLLDDPTKGNFEVIAGRIVMDALDPMDVLDSVATVSGSSGLNESKDVEPNSQEEPSTKCEGRFDEISTSQEIISCQVDGVTQIEEGGNIPPDNGHPMEEAAPVYGPLPYSESDDRTENTNECRDLVLVPSNSNGVSAGDQSSANLDTTVTSNSKAESSASVKLPSRGSDEDGDEDAGIGGLFDDDESPFSTVPEYKFETSSHESSSFSLLDSMVAVPVLGPILNGRSGSARDVTEADTYPTMSLEGCLQAFTKTEVLSGEDAWGCDNCTRIAHAQREAEQQEQAETDSLQQLRETEGHSNDVGSASVRNDSATPAHGTLFSDGDALQEEWVPVGLEDRMEDSSTSTTVSEGRDRFSAKLDQLENGTIPELNGNQNGVGAVDGRNEVDFAELNISGGDSSNNRDGNALRRSLSLDGFDQSNGLRPVKAGESQVSAFQEEKEDAEEPCSMVEGSDKRTHKSDMVKKDRKGKASVKIGAQAGASKAKEASDAKKVDKDPPKMVTVKRDATKRFLISKAPLVLTVHLKRFAQDLHGRLSKLSGHITFHEQLDLAPFIEPRPDGVKPDVVYQLIGTVEHSGTMRGGHYVAYVKGCKMEGRDSSEGAPTWYYISDSHVRETCLESVLQSEAYLLFYERQTLE